MDEERSYFRKMWHFIAATRALEFQGARILVSHVRIENWKEGFNEDTKIIFPKYGLLSVPCHTSLGPPPSSQYFLPFMVNPKLSNIGTFNPFGLNQPFNHPLNRLSPSYIHYIPGSPMRDREILTKLGYLKLSSVSHPKNDPGYLTKSTS